MPNQLKLQYTVEFKTSRKRAFDYIKEVKNRKHFMTIVDQTKITHPVKGENLKGLRFVEVTHFLGFDMKLNYEIVDYKDGHTITTACNDGPFYPVMGITLNERSPKTCTGEVNVSLQTDVLKLIPSFLIKPTVEAIIKPILKKMVAAVEES